ncbi:MAG: endonuclease/exonuclease/phosphatase family protein [Candidatus Saccharimonadales bacterium]
MPKLMQLNMWGGRLEKLITPFLVKEQADILCLQESISLTRGRNSGFFLTIEQIQDTLSLSNVCVAPVFAFDYMESEARFGNAILSKFPIKKSEVLFTHLSYKDKFVFGQDNNNVRNFVHTELLIQGNRCHVITHHGFHVRDHKNGTPETVEQMTQLSNYIKQLTGPVILTGDFNLAPTSPSLHILNDHLKNLCIEHNISTTRNSLTTKTEVCDYIFVNNDITVNNFSVPRDIVSDHLALILDFTL